MSWREYYLIDGFLFFMKQTEWSYCQISFWLWMKRNSVRLIMKRKLYARSYSLQFQRKLRYSSLHTDVVQLVRDAAMQMHGFTSQHREPVQTLWINIFYSLNVWEAGQNWGHPPPLASNSSVRYCPCCSRGFSGPKLGQMTTIDTSLSDSCTSDRCSFRKRRRRLHELNNIKNFQGKQ